MAPAIDDSDIRDKRLRVRVSATEQALVERLAREDDIPIDRWIRDLILQALEQRAGYVDTARRSAPRRRNRQADPD